MSLRKQQQFSFSTLSFDELSLSPKPISSLQKPENFFEAISPIDKKEFTKILARETKDNIENLPPDSLMSFIELAILPILNRKDRRIICKKVRNKLNEIEKDRDISSPFGSESSF